MGEAKMISQVLEWLSPAVTQHVALALFHFLWQGALIAIAVVVILRLLRDNLSPGDAERQGASHSRAGLRYTIACLGLLTMVALPVVNLLMVRPPVQADRAESVAAVEHGGRHALMSGSAERAAIGMSLDFGASPNTGEAALRPSEPGPSTRSSLGTSLLFRFVLQGFFWVWIAGVVTLSVWQVVAWHMSQRFRRGALAPCEVVDTVKQIAGQLGIRRAIAVRQTLELATPIVIGWIKPVLVLPMSILTKLSPAELEAVLAHELAHVRRHDYAVNLLQAVIETVLFYHPAVWWLSRRIRVEREFCTDDLAMGVCQGRDIYAHSLVALAEVVHRPPAHAVAATGGRLVTRIRRAMFLADSSAAKSVFANTSLTAMAAVLCAGLTVMAAGQVGVNTPGDSVSATDTEGAASATPESSQEGAKTRSSEDSTHRPGSSQHIEAALEENCELEFIEAPLATVMEYLADKHRIPFVLDVRALDDQGVAKDVPVTKAIKGIPLADALDYLTKDLNLTWCVKHNVVLITTGREVGWDDVRLYKLRGSRGMADLIQDIQANVSPESWNRLGGPACLAPYASDTLVVKQSYQFQRQIERDYAEWLQPVLIASDVVPPSLEGTQMARQLNQITDLEVFETPLGDVMDDLSKRNQVKIVLDEQALADVNIKRATPISRKLTKLPLRSVLSLLVLDLDLAWEADKNEIRITTPEVTEVDLLTEHYLFNDLVLNGEMEPLFDLIYSTIEPHSWEHVGGWPTIRTGVHDVIVIRHSFDAHWKIHGLLKGLREAKGT
jgi:beta-lactamase regulating signal transducer with metallopeptidase domain